MSDLLFDKVASYNQPPNKPDFFYLHFNGYLKQENIIKLLSIIENQPLNSKVKNKLYFVVIEMLQNIIKHGVSITRNTNGQPASLLILEGDNEIILTTRNYIGNQEAGVFKKQIEHVNNLNYKELDEYYTEKLFDFESGEQSGLGIIDIRVKTKRLLNYDFKKLNNQYSFFILQTGISKN